MKLLLIFSILILTAPAFSDDLNGTTWALSGVGCRERVNGSLDPSTHVSKLPTSGDVTAGIIYFVDGSNVNMTTTVKGTERSDSGTYSVSGNTVTITGASGGNMTIDIVGERLVIVGSRTESAKECCSVQIVEDWKGYKKEVENWPANRGGNTHSLGTWEEQKAKNGWDEQWLAENETEWNELRDKCRNEKPFVYVLGTVD